MGSNSDLLGNASRFELQSRAGARDGGELAAASRPTVWQGGWRESRERSTFRGDEGMILWIVHARGECYWRQRSSAIEV